MKLKKTQKKKIIQIAISVIIIIVGVLAGTIKKEEILNIIGIEKQANISEGEYIVTSVVDGDTLKIQYNGTEQKVRLIGIDTPESVHPDKNKNTEYGKKASEYTKKLVEGTKVKLEFDVSQTDKYGRLLAYVYLENGEMLNEKLLKQGYAQIATYAPNVKYVEKFKQIQKEARENKNGFWNENVF